MPGLPHTAFAWGCLALGCAFAWPRLRQATSWFLGHYPRRYYTLSLALGTFGLSVAYVHFVLGGAPRIIDATSYWLQARIFAEGRFSFAPPGPLHAFAGRFLVVTPSGELAVLFPPGFAAVLAIGMRLGIPMLVNPLLGAGCSVLTYALGRTWFGETAGRVAGVTSALCAAMRYHSADTMSHLWSACLVLGLLLAVEAQRATPRRLFPLLAGVCAGWLFATRPVTGLVFGGFGVAALVWQTRSLRDKLQTLGALVLGMTPGLGLWFGYQWLTTGSPWSTAQGVYYARSDWPEGCFRLGLASDIGCRFEHGDFLAANQPHGYGPVEALRVTARRLWLHNRDVINLPWLPLLNLLGLRAAVRSRPVVLAWTLWLTHVAAYALFYFDGNYPGGGARFYAEVLPLQHVLLGAVLTQLGKGWSSVPLAALGFALYTGPDHTAVGQREGGRPMYEPRALADAGVTRGLVFVNTDHGFNLGFEPGAKPEGGPLVVRARGDALDYATWVYWNRSPAVSYTFDPFRPNSAPLVTAFQPAPTSLTRGANLWPPLDVQSGSATPNYGPPCHGTSLSLHPHSRGAPQTTVVVPWVTEPGSYQLEVQSDGLVDVAEWPVSVLSDETQGACRVSRSAPRQLKAGPLSLTLVNSDPVQVSTLTLHPTPPPTPDLQGDVH